MKSCPASLVLKRYTSFSQVLGLCYFVLTLSAALTSAPWPRRSSTIRPWPWAAATWRGDRPCPSGVVNKPVERLSKRPATAPWPPRQAKCKAVKPLNRIVVGEIVSGIISWLSFSQWSFNYYNYLFTFWADGWSTVTPAELSRSRTTFSSPE